MVSLATVTGLRCSELLALKWQDCDFASEEIRLTRAIVCAQVGALKTEAAAKPIPMDEGLATLAGLARTMPVQSRERLVFWFSSNGGQATAVAL